MLYGISHHMGGMGGGHYVADTKNSGDGNWYHYDDSHVGKIRDPSVSSTAYVLFYERVSA